MFVDPDLLRTAATNFSERAVCFALDSDHPDHVNFATLAAAASVYLELAAEAHEHTDGAHVPIVRAWVSKLGLRHQGTLMSAVRGCDGTPKDADPSKWIMRFYRTCILRAHVGDPRKSASYMEWTDDFAVFWENACAFLNDFDRYPAHFIIHVLHAAAILAYKMPGDQGVWWTRFYARFCEKLHVNPETEEQLDARLNADEKSFGAAQKIS